MPLASRYSRQSSAGSAAPCPHTNDWLMTLQLATCVVVAAVGRSGNGGSNREETVKSLMPISGKKSVRSVL